MFSLVLVSIFAGCGMPKPSEFMGSTEIQYIEIQDIYKEVVPKLETGYEILGNAYIRTSNNKITVENFIGIGENSPQYSDAEIVMVKLDTQGNTYKYTAYYLNKRDTESEVLGAYFQDNEWSQELKDIRRELNSNKGCIISAVYYGTPAYKYSMHSGDVVLYANNHEINSCNHFQRIIDDSSILNLTVWANGNRFDMNEIRLNK